MNTAKGHLVFCSTSFADYDRRILRITKTLADAGYRITWISRVKTSMDEIDWLDHVKISSPFKGGLLFYAWLNILLFLKLLRHRKSIIVSIDLDTILPAYLISVLTRRQMVFDAHEFFTEVPELEGRKSVKSFWNIIANTICPRIQYNYTVSQSLADIFAEKYNVNYKLIRNIGEPDAIQNTESILNKRLIYLGVLNQGRGIEVAIEALVSLSDWSLCVIGGGDVEEELQMLASHLGVENRTEFMGYIKPTEISNVLTSGGVGINILNAKSKSYYYSLANKHFDYLHSNIPSISMHFPEYILLNSEFETSVLIKEYSVEDFIAAVKIFEDENFYTQCRENCKLATLKYNWNEESKKLLAFYMSIV